MNNPPTSHHTNPTIPTTIGALLTEEYTINPLSHLPSFLELTFVDVARNSGRRALHAFWEVCVAKLTTTLEHLRRMERLADRMLERIDILQRQHQFEGNGPSLKVRLHRVIREIARARIQILRRVCQFVLGTTTTLGPELQTLIMYAIDYNCMHYLAGSTACEMVYGLKRSKVIHTNASNHHVLSKDAKKKNITPPLSRVAELNKFDKTLSAVLAALLPYCKERCDKWYNDWKEGPLTGRSMHHNHQSNLRTNRQYTINTTSIADVKEKFVKLYPYLHMVHDGSIFLYQFGYLLGFTPYWSFSLHAMRVILRRMTVADVQQQQQQKQQLEHQQQNQRKGGALLTSPISTNHAQPQSFQNIHVQNAVNSSGRNSLLPMQQLTLPRLIKGAVLFSISYTLLSGWCSHFRHQLRLRRRRWIAGHDDVETTNNTIDDDGRNPRSIAMKLPIPPPPLSPNLIDEIDSSVDKWSCPICKETRINPTAATSGYVYCYKCIVSHIRNVGEYCPLTGMPCPERRVVRLFEPTAPTIRRGVAVG